MINILVHELNQHTVDRLLRTAGDQLRDIRKVTYQQAFRRLSVPAGTLIFTDFDYLSGIEMDIVAAMATAATAANPETKILNHPCYACERYALLKRLHARGLNQVEVTRLEDTDRPSRYPVFIRLEDGAWGPDTDLIENEEGFLQALSDLAANGQTSKRRVAVSFEGTQDKDGYFRKYGAFRIGDAIIPQHILRGQDWIVKSRFKTYDEAFLREEFEYVRDNPHRDQLLRICDVGGLQFGRIDYGFSDGVLVVFEINPNPEFPRFIGGNPKRQERRSIILNGLRDAFETVNAPAGNRGSVGFLPPPGRRKFMQVGRWNRAWQLLWKLRLAWKSKSLPF
jgi:hypothetical protein